MPQANESPVTRLSIRDQERLSDLLNDEAAEPNPALIAAAIRYYEQNPHRQSDAEEPRH
jgi:hypothetical protein